MTTRIAFILALAAPVAGVSAAQTAKPAKNYTPADVHFVAGMIGHHAQAIQMAGWAPSHGASPSIRVLCERIVVAQNDEIVFAQRWLREHGVPACQSMAGGIDAWSTVVDPSVPRY